MKKTHTTLLSAIVTLLVLAVPTSGQAEKDSASTGVGVSSASDVRSERSERYEYRLLATSKTSTMEKELNQAAAQGFRFETVMGGETAFGGSEAVVVMSRTAARSARVEYKLLATNKTSTMQRELQQAAALGFEYRGQTVYKSSFGGREVVIILERDGAGQPGRFEYKLLATSKTSTMQKELNQFGQEGYTVLGLTVGETAFGGKEVVAILRRPTTERSDTQPTKN